MPVPAACKPLSGHCNPFVRTGRRVRALPASAASARTRSGTIGTATSARVTPSASSTAAATAAPAPSTPPSPAPFAPSGLPGDGASSRIAVPTGGTSAADGIR